MNKFKINVGDLIIWMKFSAEPGWDQPLSLALGAIPVQLVINVEESGKKIRCVPQSSYFTNPLIYSTMIIQDYCERGLVIIK
jgi:hypothetical protein